MVASRCQEKDQESDQRRNHTAVLFGALQSLGSLLQSVLPGVPTQVFQVAPFVLMILVLVLVSSQGLDRFLGLFPGRIGGSLAGFFRVTPPSALSKRFERE